MKIPVGKIDVGPTPRPLEFNQKDYWLAPSGLGPLAAEWRDKPHRLVYDLIGALRYERENDRRAEILRQLEIVSALQETDKAIVPWELARDEDLCIVSVSLMKLIRDELSALERPALVEDTSRA